MKLAKFLAASILVVVGAGAAHAQAAACQPLKSLMAMTHAQVKAQQGTYFLPAELAIAQTVLGCKMRTLLRLQYVMTSTVRPSLSRSRMTSCELRHSSPAEFR